MKKALIVCLGILASAGPFHLTAQETSFLPLAEIKAGSAGVGRTVFQGDAIEEFDVEILGVLHNVGPKQSLILGKLSGGPIEQSGVIAGMSGSPVYIGGKLIGAVAFAYPFAKEAISGIRPIEEMVNGFGGPEPRPVNASADELVRLASAVNAGELSQAPFAMLSSQPTRVTVEASLEPIGTPVNLAGFSEGTLAVFGDSLRRLGLRPVQGIGGRSAGRGGEAVGPTLEPGSMISVALIRGDLELSAAGTVTHVDGDRIFAFGHRFLASGSTAMPFMRSSVLTVLPNLAVSSKIVGSGAHLGAITDDRSVGIHGRLGSNPSLAPVSLRMRSANGYQRDYSLEMVNDPFLTPAMLQMALFSAADATERQVGGSTYTMQGTVKFEGATPELRLDNVFSGVSGVPLQLATTGALPLAYLMQLSPEKPRIQSVAFEIEASEEERKLRVARAWSSQTRVKAGEDVEVSAALQATDGQEVIRRTTFTVPSTLPPGALRVTFSDASSLNLLEWQGLLFGRGPKDATNLVRALNRLRRSDRLYLQVWRPAPGYRVGNRTLSSLPASAQTVLSTPGAAGQGVSRDFRALFEEVEFDEQPNVVQGSATIQLIVTR